MTTQDDMFGHKKEPPKPRQGSIKTFTEFNGSWEEYKNYLDYHGALSPKLKKGGIR